MAHIWLAIMLNSVYTVYEVTVQSSPTDRNLLASLPKCCSSPSPVLHWEWTEEHQSWCPRLRVRREGKPAGKHHSTRCCLLSTQPQSSFRKTVTPLFILDALDRLACPTQYSESEVRQQAMKPSFQPPRVNFPKDCSFRAIISHLSNDFNTFSRLTCLIHFTAHEPHLSTMCMKRSVHMHKNIPIPSVEFITVWKYNSDHANTQ